MLAAKQKPSGVDELAKGYHWVATIASGEVISTDESDMTPACDLSW